MARDRIVRTVDDYNRLLKEFDSGKEDNAIFQSLILASGFLLAGEMPGAAAACAAAAKRLLPEQADRFPKIA